MNIIFHEVKSLKSICIKTISEEKIEYLISELEKINLKIIISNYRFKTYDNLIIHYKSDDFIEDFFEEISEVIKKLIVKYYEEDIINKSIEKNYFYLSSLERKYILEITKKVLELPDEKIGYKNKLLKEIIKKYVLENKKIIIEGFVNFRIKEYKELLEKIVEVSVFSYLDLITF